MKSMNKSENKFKNWTFLEFINILIAEKKEQIF